MQTLGITFWDNTVTKPGYIGGKGIRYEISQLKYADPLWQSLGEMKGTVKSTFSC